MLLTRRGLEAPGYEVEGPLGLKILALKGLPFRRRGVYASSKVVHVLYAITLVLIHHYQ